MENTGFKGILTTLWQRVVLSYKSTLIGLLVMVAGYFVEVYAQSPNKIISTVAAVIGAILVFYKEQTKPAPAPVP